ncbi:integrase [Gammaproteobacteria bacterium ESL0073]|nr:integrase [Gammaproteobacteria bacterium ESL0073]
MPKKIAPLTDTKIHKTKPKDKPFKLSDGEGLYIEIFPNGSKLWRVKYIFDGKEKRIALGNYPTVSLSYARELKQEVRTQVKKGIDPVLNRKIQKNKQGINDFESLANEWYNICASKWSDLTKLKTRRYLDKDIIPFFRKRDIGTIKRVELVSLIKKIESRNVSEPVKKTRIWLNQIFRFAIAKGIIESNPATDLDIVTKAAPKQKPMPHVNFSELKELLKSVKLTNSPILAKSGVYLLALTGLRTGELRLCKWEYVDFDQKIITIPEHITKTKHLHVIPLSEQCVSILNNIKEISAHYDFIFIGQSLKKPLTEMTFNLCLRKAGYKDRQTGHGFRHLLSTELNSRGYNHDWIEKQLAHGDTDKIRGTYNHASYLDQRRVMMQEWADSIDFDFKVFR